MKKRRHIKLGYQALIFSMKRAGHTSAELSALAASALACDPLALTHDFLHLRAMALQCAKADPLTDDHVAALAAALDALEPPLKVRTASKPVWVRAAEPVAEIAPPFVADEPKHTWQDRKDIG